MTTTDDQRATMYVGNNKETVITENIRNMTLWNECMSVRLQTGVSTSSKLTHADCNTFYYDWCQRR